MARLPQRYFWLLTWVIVCAGLSAAVAWQYLRGTSLTDLPPPMAPRVAEAKLLPGPPRLNSTEAGDASLSRPLFVPARRPSPPAVPADAAPTFKRGQYSLQGTIVTGDQSYAFLRHGSSGKVQRVARGGKVAELTVSEVTSTSATLALGEETEVLPLILAKGPPVVPPQAQRAGANPAQAAVAPVPSPAAPASANGATPQAAPAAALLRSSDEFLRRRREALTRGVGPSGPAAGNAGSSAQSSPLADGEITFAEIARRRAQEAAIR